MIAAEPPAIAFHGDAAPIRAELFSAERLEQHAESLAVAQSITRQPVKGRPLLPRVIENGRVLLEYYRATARAIQRERTIIPAAEWLVDNFYIVEEQLREIRDDLPPGFIASPKACVRPPGGFSARLWCCMGLRRSYG